MKLVIVVPCYNEELVLHETTRRLVAVLQSLMERKSIDEGMILYVDDGSKDKTWSIIETLSKETSQVGGLKLSCNRGHQYALWAGLEWASAHSDASVSIDADLQDDVNAICLMVDEYHKGNDIVFGVRKERKTDTFFKRTTALAFYRLMRFFDRRIIYNHADFRLMSRRAMLSLMEYPEDNLFLRGIVASMGYPSTSVYYDRSERFAGESKYPFKKMLNFAIDGITSFSVKPVRMVFWLGCIFILIAVCVTIWTLRAYYFHDTVPGWSSLMISLWLVGGTILVSLGIVGEYIGKIYIEVKNRPRYNEEELLLR